MVESFDKIKKTQMWSRYQGLSRLGGKFSHVEEKSSVLGFPDFWVSILGKFLDFLVLHFWSKWHTPIVMGRCCPPIGKTTCRLFPSFINVIISIGEE